MPSPRIRQDIWTLEQEQTQKPTWHPITMAYALAIRELRQRPDNDPTSWTYQAAVHGTTDNPDRWRNQCQHVTWYFLPWHRMYLYWFEQIVRRVIQELKEVDDETKEAWALPYWDYSRNEVTRSLPPAFRSDTLPDGSENPLFDPTRDPRLNSGRFGLGPLQVDLGALRWPVFSLPVQPGRPSGFGGPPVGLHHTFGGGQGALEGTPHGAVHVAVGGRMGHPNSAGLDPIFWLHHANIDRLWSSWLAQPGRSNPTSTAWLDQDEFFFHNENGEAVDENGDDIKHTTRQVLDEVADLGYKYAELSTLDEVRRAGPLEAVAMSEPPERPTELVGATDEPLELTGHPATVRFEISRPSGPLSAEEAGPSHVYLNVENIQAEENPGLSYAVYVNVPDEDDDPTNDAHYVGNVTFFGIELAQDLDRDHPGGHGGLRHAFDITDLYTRLRDEGKWDQERVTVTFAPLDLVPLQTAGPLAAEPEPPEPEPESEEETPPVTIGRVSLFYE